MASEEETEQMGRPENGLDYDCLFEVFKYLTLKERVKSERVCKQWQDAAYDVNRQQSSLCLFSSGVSDVFTFCSDPGHRVSRNDFVFSCASMSIVPILKRCPNLRSLHVQCSEQPIVEQGEGKWVPYYCPNLEHLSFVDNRNGTAIRTELVNMLEASIVHLQLRFTPETSEGFKQENDVVNLVLLLLPELSILSLNIPLTAGSCLLLSETRVNKLELRGTSFTPSGLTTYLKGSGKYLTDLKLLVEDDDQLEEICDNVKNLSLFHCITGHYLESCGVIGKLEKLTTLFLSSWSDEPLDENLLQIMDGCSSLKHLTINGQVSDVSLRCIPVYLPLIEYIEVNMTSEESVTDKTMSSLSLLRNLKHLSLEKCEVSDEGFKLPLFFCPLLDFIRVGFSQKMTADSILFCREIASQKKHKFLVTLPFLLDTCQAKKLLQDLPLNLRIEFHSHDEFCTNC